MKKFRSNVYIVRVDETVSIEVDPQDGAGEEETAMSIDEKVLKSSGGTKPTYVFDDTAQPDDHFGILECDFAQAPDEAFFLVTLKGSEDGLDRFVINKSDAIHDVDLEFRVRNEADYDRIRPR
jgi:hypothetical protein